MKNIIFAIFLIIFIGQNTCLAANWIPIEAKDYKTVELDLDSITKNNDNLLYDVKLLKGDIHSYTVTRFNINTKSNTYAQIGTTTYEQEQKIGYVPAINIEYKPIKPDSLNDNIYKTIKLIIGSEQNIDKSIIEKYAKEQQKKIIKYWKPSNYNTETQGFPVLSECLVSLILDKNGNIISYKYRDIKYSAISHVIESDIYHIIHTKIGTFDKLPNKYNADRMILFITLYYSNDDNYKNIENRVSLKNNSQIGYIAIAKDSSSAMKTIVDVGGTILSIPFYILSAVLGVPQQ